MKRLFLTITLFLLVSACGNKEKAAVPSRLLSEQEMIDLMTDVQIIEADMNLHRTQGTMPAGMAKSYYEQLFEHYNITDSIYVENLHYYTREPAVMERIMDSVYQRLLNEQKKIPVDNEEAESNDNKPSKTSLQHTLK